MKTAGQVWWNIRDANLHDGTAHDHNAEKWTEMQPLYRLRNLTAP